MREKFPWLPVDFAYDVAVGANYGETISLTDYIKRNPIKILTPDEEFLAELDEESLNDLREDEEERAEREAVKEIAEAVS